MISIISIDILNTDVGKFAHRGQEDKIRAQCESVHGKLR